MRVLVKGIYFGDTDGTLAQYLVTLNTLSPGKYVLSDLAFDLSATAAPAFVANRLAQLNSDFAAALATLNTNYPPGEQDTFLMQAEEAKQYSAAVSAAASSMPPTPFLTQLWTTRQAQGVVETFDSLVSSVLANSVANLTATARLIGIRQAAAASLAAAADPTTVAWSFA